MSKRCVIYSACIGDYDEVRQPMAIDDRYDYVLFCDRPLAKSVWSTRLLPFQHCSPAKTARWAKTHPEELFPGYEFSVWIDSNLQIVDADVYRMIDNLIDDGTPLSALRHPWRNCIYDEAAEILKLQLEKEETIVNWLHQLFRNQYPRHNGLAETGFLFRRHHDTRIAQLDREWWDCIQQYSHRDQLSFDYVAWRTGLSYRHFLDNDIRQDRRFYLSSHKKTISKTVLTPHPSKLYRYMKSRPHEYNRLWETYLSACRRSLPRWAVAVAGQKKRLQFWIQRHRQQHPEK